MIRPDVSARLPRIFAAVLAVLFAVGIAGHLVAQARPLMAAITWIVLVINAGLVLSPLAWKGSPGLAAWCAGAWAAGFALEVAGVTTGLVFGPYAYGTVLGPAVLGVPLVIGANWALVILGCLAAVVRVAPRLPAVPAAIIAAALTVVFDAVMEPVAVALGYWTWTGGAIPVRNYVAWFLISVVLAVPAALRLPAVLREHAAPRLASFSTGIQLVFFGILRLTVA